ncbi:MAG TPA: DUF4147 domain-containing protein [Blastocatellia bacterium]|nr:DUF4147 domain-containing protein [Blastocatellia bacterium]
MEPAEQARDIFLASLAAIDVKAELKRRVRVEDETLFIDRQEIALSGKREVLVIGFGKASLPMGAAVEEMLGDRFSRGILVTDRRHRVKVKSDVIVAGHPLPNANSLLAGERIISAIESCADDCLIIFLISGGGSSLVEAPITPDVSLEDLQKLNKLLVGCGANIREINTIRKRLSRIKGGKLGLLASRLRSVGVFISDVNPGDIRSLASNPLLPEARREGEVEEIIERYNLGPALPESIRSALNLTGGGLLPEGASREGDWLTHIVLLDNRDAVDAAAAYAARLGYLVEIDFENAEGDYRVVADRLIEKLRVLQSSNPGRPVCLVSGGEVSCPVKGDGLGGRNQEFVLYSASRQAAFDRESSVTVLSCGTDGIDGNSNAAGAVAGVDVVHAISKQGIDLTGYFSRSDVHSFFRQFGGAVFTGPTGNNVRDIRILLSNPVSSQNL